MGSGALVLVWSHPPWYAPQSYLSPLPWPLTPPPSGPPVGHPNRIRHVPAPAWPTRVGFFARNGPQSRSEDPPRPRRGVRVGVRREDLPGPHPSQYDPRFFTTMARKVETESRLGPDGAKKWGCNTRTSQGVTHPSTTLAQARLTSEFWWDPVH